MSTYIYHILTVVVADIMNNALACLPLHDKSYTATPSQGQLQVSNSRKLNASLLSSCTVSSKEEVVYNLSRGVRPCVRLQFLLARESTRMMALIVEKLG